MGKQTKDIQITKFNDAIGYRMNNKRLFIEKVTDDLFSIETRILKILTEEQKKEMFSYETPISVLVHRNHSKYCVWHNRVTYSRIAFECLFQTRFYIDDLIMDETQSNSNET